MKLTHYALALLIAVVVIGGCKKTEEVATGAVDAPPAASTQEIAGTTNPSDLNPVSAQSYIDDVTIGHEVGADGKVPAGKTGDDFAPGQTVFVTMQVKDAPAGSAVKVVWFGPNETKITEETKPVPSGATFLTFDAKDTKSWAKGDYRADVFIGDEKVNSQQFQIVDAAGAGK